jgi:hypothetical protein
MCTMAAPPDSGWIGGGGPLRDIFPRLFAIAMQPRVTIVVLFRDNSCRVTFRRELGFGEQVEWDSLSLLVEGINISEPQDTISWYLEPDGRFSVQSLYKSMCHGTRKHYGACRRSRPHSNYASSSSSWLKGDSHPMTKFVSVGALPMVHVPHVGRWKIITTSSFVARWLVSCGARSENYWIALGTHCSLPISLGLCTSMLAKLGEFSS